MLEYSVHVYEKFIKHAVPDVTEEEIDQIVYNYPIDNPLHYPDFWDTAKKYHPNLSKERIDQIFMLAVKEVLRNENPIDMAVLSLLII